MKTPTNFGYQLWLGNDAHHTARLAARYIATRLRFWLHDRPHTLLLLSGGTSPLPLFQALSEEPLDWSRITVSLVDERWVPPDHADSNQHLIEQHFLHKLPEPPHFIPLYHASCNPDHGAERLQRIFAPMSSWPALAVLGLGEDGHTASLFPDAPEYGHALTTQRDWIAVHPTHAPHARMSASLHRLLSCSDRLLYLPSVDKRQRFHELVDRAVAPSPVAKLIQQAQRPLHVFSVNNPSGDSHDPSHLR